MLRLLAEVRKSMISSDSTRKYLLYAIGEIALVVIGILIALQVNNWNELKKERKLERKILINVSENLEANIELLTKHIDELDIYNRSFDIIKNAKDHHWEYNDSLDYHFHKAHINGHQVSLNWAAYEGFKNIGFEIVKNDTLQKAIIDLFEVKYAQMFNNLNWGGEDVIWLSRYLDEHFIRPLRDNTGGELKPLDYDFIMRDRYFYVLMVKYRAQRRFFKNQLLKAKIMTEEVLGMLKKELKTFEL